MVSYMRGASMLTMKDDRQCTKEKKRKSDGEQLDNRFNLFKRMSMLRVP